MGNDNQNSGNKLDLSKLKTAQPAARSLYPPQATKTVVPPSKEEGRMTEGLKAPSQKGLYKALRLNYVILANGQKIKPNKDKIFDSADLSPEAVAILEYFASQRHGLVEKI